MGDINTDPVIEKIKNELWETWAIGPISKRIVASGPTYYAIGYKANANYGNFILMSYFVSRPMYVIVFDGVFSDYVRI